MTYKSLILYALVLFTFSGCAHSYFYTPEIDGEGARVGKGGIVFLIPERDTLIKMKLLTSGVAAAPPEAKSAKISQQTKMLLVRLLFLRTPQAANLSVRINPSELKLIPPWGPEINVALIHSPAHQGKMIELSKATKQGLDVWFTLPGNSRGDVDLQDFQFRWKIHYGPQASQTTLAQTTRFDRHDRGPEQGAELFPWDADFPYDLSPILPPGWIYDPWGWWEP